MDLLKTTTEEVRMEGTKTITNEKERRRSKRHNKEKTGETTDKN